MATLVCSADARQHARTKRKNVPKTVATLVCSAGARNTLGPKNQYTNKLHLLFGLVQTEDRGLGTNGHVMFCNLKMLSTYYLYFAETS